jgi:hypothetical protein
MTGITVEPARAPGLFAAALEQQFSSLHEEAEEPPDPPDPSPGDEAPAGDPCPHCGEARLWWVYNPYARRTLNGWTKHRTWVCACPESDPHHPAAGRPARPAAMEVDQRWLDGQFLQRPTYGQTFLSFRCPEASPLRPLLEAVQAFAQRGDHAGGRGLYLAGPPSIGKGHLASALVNAARARGIPALSMTAAFLLDVSLSAVKETEEEADARADRRKALRAVPVLAIRDLFRQPLLPTEVKELDLLLDYREGRDLTTHFTSPYAFAQLRVLSNQTDARAALVRRIERLTERELVAPPRTPPFTERMAQASREAGGGQR